MGHSTNAIRVKFYQMTILSILAMALCLTAIPTILFAKADGEQLAMSLRQNVVRITSTLQDRGDNGFGFIVGEHEGRVFIATANHVVRDKKTQKTARPIIINYFQDQGTNYEAKLVGQQSQTSYDLAILEAPAPKELEWYPFVLGEVESRKRGTLLWYIGRTRDWYVPTEPGRLNHTLLNFDFRADNLNIQKGTSGAPLLADTGIIGMQIEDEGAGVSRALSIEIIQRACNLWGIPWDLEPFQKSTIPALATDITIHLHAGDRFVQLAIETVDRNIRHKKFVKALEEYNKALEDDPENIEVLKRIVSTMRMDIWPRSGDGDHFKLKDGKIKNEITQAWTLLHKAQALDPSLMSNRDLFFDKAYLFRSRGWFKLATKAMADAYKLYPNDPDIMAELGFYKAKFSSKIEMISEGIELIRKALAIDLNHPRYHWYLAKALEEKIYETAPRNPGTHTVSDSFRNGNPEEVEETIREHYKAATLAKEQDSLLLYKISGRELETITRGYFFLPDDTFDALNHEVLMPIDERIKICELKCASRYSTKRSEEFLARLYYEKGDYQKANQTLQTLLNAHYASGGREIFEYEIGSKLKEHGLPFFEFHAKILEAGKLEPDLLAKVKVYVQAIRDKQQREEEEKNRPQITKALEVGRKKTYRIGVEVQEEKDNLRILKVYDQYPFAKAGFQQGDKILEFAHRKITKLDDMTDLIQRFSPGVDLPVKIRRGNAILMNTFVIE